MPTRRPVASVDAYVRALRRAELNAGQREILKQHYCVARRRATATELARLVGYKNKNAINLQYGTLAAAVARELGLWDPAKDSIRIFSTFSWSRGQSVHMMRPEVAKALEVLGWV